MISKNKIKWIRSLEMKKHRAAEGVFVAEGPKVVGDLLAAGFECVFMACTEEYDKKGRELWSIVDAKGVEVCWVTQEELERISFVDTPQMVLAVFRQPEWQWSEDEVESQLCLALDGVQNPGNLGTIVRLADWFGIEYIFCSQGCADVYNPKTVQATMGALARVKVCFVDLIKLLSDAHKKNVPVYGTFLNGDSIYDKVLEQRGLIVMGNEGRGISKGVEALVTDRLYVPHYPQGRSTTDSLNVAIATAVVCAEFRRRVV